MGINIEYLLGTNLNTEEEYRRRPLPSEIIILVENRAYNSKIIFMTVK